jgi:hypothetical protein
LSEVERKAAEYIAYRLEQLVTLCVTSPVVQERNCKVKEKLAKIEVPKFERKFTIVVRIQRHVESLVADNWELSKHDKQHNLSQALKCKAHRSVVAL